MIYWQTAAHPLTSQQQVATQVVTQAVPTKVKSATKEERVIKLHRHQVQHRAIPHTKVQDTDSQNQRQETNGLNASKESVNTKREYSCRKRNRQNANRQETLKLYDESTTTL